MAKTYTAKAQDTVQCASDTCTSDFRSTGSKTYCSSKCRVRQHKRNTANSAKVFNPDMPILRADTVYLNQERADLLNRTYDRVFGVAPERRADVLLAFLVSTAQTQIKIYKDVMLYPASLSSNRFTAKSKDTAKLHYRHNPMTYPATLARMINNVCRTIYGVSSGEFVKRAKAGDPVDDLSELGELLREADQAGVVFFSGIDVEHGPNDAPQETLQEFLARTANSPIKSYRKLLTAPVCDDGFDQNGIPISNYLDDLNRHEPAMQAAMAASDDKEAKDAAEIVAFIQSFQQSAAA